MKQKLPLKALVQEEKPPSFDFDWDIINKQIDTVRGAISEVCHDGIVSEAEFSRVLMELQILDALLISFKDEEFNKQINETVEFYNQNIYTTRKIGKFSEEDVKKFGFQKGLDDVAKSYNIKVINSKHILDYFKALNGLVQRASFQVKNG